MVIEYIIPYFFNMSDIAKFKNMKLIKNNDVWIKVMIEYQFFRWWPKKIKIIWFNRIFNKYKVFILNIEYISPYLIQIKTNHNKKFCLNIDSKFHHLILKTLWPKIIIIAFPCNQY